MTRTSFRLNRTLAAFAATALMAGSAAPAFAAANNSNSNSSQTQAASAEAAPQSTQASRGAGNRRICVVGDFTGSRLQQRVCKTEREWEAAGGVPTAE
jgi:hypothetical protein